MAQEVENDGMAKVRFLDHEAVRRTWNNRSSELGSHGKAPPHVPASPHRRHNHHQGPRCDTGEVSSSQRWFVQVHLRELLDDDGEMTLPSGDTSP
jgi:hypothetical protein